MSKEFQIEGNFHLALQYLIRNSTEDVLGVWDKLRGSDWYTGTKANEECNEWLEYQKLKSKFED